jgi:AcrR family transcriptional regulator
LSDRLTTRERILEASRKLFNENGYAATPVSEIAARAGIATGNLTYHFATKRELAEELERRARRQWREARTGLQTGVIASDYVEILRSGMKRSWENRFLFRDRTQYRDDTRAHPPDHDMAADLEMLHEYLQRMNKEGMFRRDLQLDLSVLARSLFVVSRYWMDHLREIDGLERVSWADQERGLQHHFAVLFPYLTAAARKEFESALVRLASGQAIEEAEARIEQ